MDKQKVTIFGVVVVVAVAIAGVVYVVSRTRCDLVDSEPKLDKVDAPLSASGEKALGTMVGYLEYQFTGDDAKKTKKYLPVVKDSIKFSGFDKDSHGEFSFVSNCSTVDLQIQMNMNQKQYDVKGGSVELKVPNGKVKSCTFVADMSYKFDHHYECTALKKYACNSGDKKIATLNIQMIKFGASELAADVKKGQFGTQIQSC